MHDLVKTNKYQLSLTIPRDALHHGKRTCNVLQTKVDAQCDKRATEFCRDIGIRKLESLGYRVALFM